MFENYNHLAELMKSMNLSCLADLQKRAEKLYESNLKEYVTVKLGNPIEKIRFGPSYASNVSLKVI